MQNFSTIRPPVRKPLQKNSCGGGGRIDPTPLRGRGLILQAMILGSLVPQAPSISDCPCPTADSFVM